MNCHNQANKKANSPILSKYWQMNCYNHKRGAKDNGGTIKLIDLLKKYQKHINCSTPCWCEDWLSWIRHTFSDLEILMLVFFVVIKKIDWNTTDESIMDKTCWINSFCCLSTWNLDILKKNVSTVNQLMLQIVNFQVVLVF